MCIFKLQNIFLWKLIFVCAFGTFYFSDFQLLWVLNVIGNGHKSERGSLRNYYTISGMFVDTGNNYSVLDHPNICFVYEYVGSKDEEKSQGDFVSFTFTIVTVLYIK